MGYIGLVAIAFQAVVRAGICHLFMVPAIARILFAKDTVVVLNIHQLIPAGVTQPSEGRTHIDVTPTGVIAIILPVKIMTTVHSWVGIQTQPR